MNYLYALIVVGVLGYVGYCERVKHNQAKAVMMAEEGRAKAEKETERLKSEKENADAENKRVMADFASRIKRLRSESGVGRVPSSLPASSRPDLACFDRADYSRAYGELVTEVRAGADEGTTATLELNSAKRWSSNALRQHQSEQ